MIPTEWAPSVVVAYALVVLLVTQDVLLNLAKERRREPALRDRAARFADHLGVLVLPALLAVSLALAARLLSAV